MRTLLFLIVNILIANANGQVQNEKIDPPGTIKLSESLFVDKTPVTNMMFLEYLTMKDYLRSQGYSSWKTYYVDKKGTDWRSGPVKVYPSFLKDLETKGSRLSRGGYFMDSEYMHTPVLNITKAQAEDFCQWRTEMVEYAWNFFPKYVGQKDYADKIHYRLPTRGELEEAQNYFSENGELVNIRKKNPLRYSSQEVPEKFTLYNISEFTSSNNLYGENWKDVVPTDFPNDYTGFRCVCEVNE